ncbi:hypothetical protein PspR32_13365 [Pseudomonas sp. R32]|nr:hypothetical protein PspR32_13365 [Pseudomonas sp. R32]
MKFEWPSKSIDELSYAHNSLSIEPRFGKLLDAILLDYLTCPILIRIIAVSPAPLGKPLQKPPKMIAVA